METAIDVAHAKILRPYKGEDNCLVRPINGDGSVQLLAVADGLSLNNGKTAAQWVIDFMEETTEVDNPRAIFNALKRELAASRYQFGQSETTLTCGILQRVGAEKDAFLRFEYFAIGDSPIWKVVKGDSTWPFQRFLVHGSPYPAEAARVYSTVRLYEGDISGAVAFGAVEVAADEVLVVCTDGIPEREVFVGDFKRPRGQGDALPGLCQWLFQQLPYQDDELSKVMRNYDQRGILSDDATIIAARVVPPCQVQVDADAIPEEPIEFFSDFAPDDTIQYGSEQSMPKGSPVGDQSLAEPSADPLPGDENECSPIQGSASQNMADLSVATGCTSHNEALGEIPGSGEPSDTDASQADSQAPSSNVSSSSCSSKDSDPNVEQAC